MNGNEERFQNEQDEITKVKTRRLSSELKRHNVEVVDPLHHPQNLNRSIVILRHQNKKNKGLAQPASWCSIVLGTSGIYCYARTTVQTSPSSSGRDPPCGERGNTIVTRQTARAFFCATVSHEFRLSGKLETSVFSVDADFCRVALHQHHLISRKIPTYFCYADDKKFL